MIEVDQISRLEMINARGVGVPFPKNGNPFSNPFLSMFLRWLKVHTHFYYLFAKICYGFRVPRNEEPAWISRLRCSKARVPKSRNPPGFLETRNSGGFWVPGNGNPNLTPLINATKCYILYFIRGGGLTMNNTTLCRVNMKEESIIHASELKLF
jgi:hypothetical protein